MTKNWQDFFDLILDVIFPKYCVNCGKLNELLCAACFEQLEFYSLPIKLQLQPQYLDAAQAVLKYQTPADKLISTMKYQSVKNITDFLAQLIYECSVVPKADLISYVPIHAQRLRERGFNQSALIAQRLAELTQQACWPLLQKKQISKRQASLSSKTERLTNLNNTFNINPTVPLKVYQKKTVLIVDDVLTTGATLNECARILKLNGVQKVIALTVAHES